MEDQMHYIDDFFQGKLSGEEVKMFEEKIVRDPEFAEEVSFYLSSKQSARDLVDEEKKKRFKALYGSSNGHHKPKAEGRVVKLRYVARVAMIAAILAAVFVTVFRSDDSSTNKLANNYLEEKSNKQLPVKMGNGDEMQRATSLYNKGDYKASLSAFEDIIKKDSTSIYAVEYAGLSALQLSDFDKALYHFKFLENIPGLSNRGVFLQALTFMKRSQKGDKEKAEQLLKRVKDENLDGKEKAEEWLKKL